MCLWITVSPPIGLRLSSDSLAWKSFCKNKHRGGIVPGCTDHENKNKDKNFHWKQSKNKLEFPKTYQSIYLRMNIIKSSPTFFKMRKISSGYQEAYEKSSKNTWEVFEQDTEIRWGAFIFLDKRDLCKDGEFLVGFLLIWTVMDLGNNWAEMDFVALLFLPWNEGAEKLEWWGKCWCLIWHGIQK